MQMAYKLPLNKSHQSQLSPPYVTFYSVFLFLAMTSFQFTVYGKKERNRAFYLDASRSRRWCFPPKTTKSLLFCFSTLFLTLASCFLQIFFATCSFFALLCYIAPSLDISSFHVSISDVYTLSHL